MFPLTITKVNEVLFRGEALSLTVPGSEGEMTILKSHTSLLSSLKEGLITVRGEGEPLHFKIEKGTIEVSKKEVIILI